MKSIKPYGSWPSNLTASILATKGPRYGHMDLDQGFLYWLEVRAAEKGRGVLVRSHSNQVKEEVLPSSISVRTKVHEYGGADYLVNNGIVYFSNADDSRIYRYDGELQALTPIDVGKEYRYADFCLDPQAQYLIAVRETHENESVINDLVCLVLETQEVRVLHSGFDFYSFPRITKLGNRICWTCWNQPDMPWDAAELWLADFHSDGSVDAQHKVTGGNTTCIFQPEWSDHGVLHYISDKSGWGNIYSHQDGVLNALTPIDREFAVPQWIFGLATYVINADDSLYALNFEAGQQQLCHIEPETGHIEPIALPFTYFEGALLGDESSLYFCAASATVELSIYRYDIKTREYFLLSDSASFPLALEDISSAQPISFNSVNDRTCHAFYYSPKNSLFEAAKKTYPPLIIMSHGGPTASTSNRLDASIQFWTHRGFAVVDVNYSGSTGYGKKYRERLTGQWGVMDVEDCVAAANYLVEKKLACKDSLLIRGGSAGGYTTLCALTFTEFFAAGVSRYGVADLETLASDCHKFEARYLDKLIGPYPAEQSTYQARSPIHFTDKLSCPILLLQGEDDKVVPPNQSEALAMALDKKKLPYAYILFEGEGHGFRQSKTIIKAFNAELDFYRQILNIDSDEKITSIEVKNLN